MTFSQEWKWSACTARLHLATDFNEQKHVCLRQQEAKGQGRSIQYNSYNNPHWQISKQIRAWNKECNQFILRRSWPTKSPRATSFIRYGVSTSRRHPSMDWSTSTKRGRSQSRRSSGYLRSLLLQRWQLHFVMRWALFFFHAVQYKFLKRTAKFLLLMVIQTRF